MILATVERTGGLYVYIIIIIREKMMHFMFNVNGYPGNNPPDIFI